MTLYLSLQRLLPRHAAADAGRSLQSSPPNRPGIVPPAAEGYESAGVQTTVPPAVEGYESAGVQTPGRFANGTEVRTLLEHGHPSSAVDLAFFSEAYGASQAEEFFEDAARILAEHFAQPEAPFFGLLPLFNVHAVFVPSASQSIPRSETAGGAAPPRRTAFGVYRDGGLLRSIVPSAGTEAAVVRACHRLLGCARCDFPVLLVREPWYGGLAGDAVTIITNSRTSGAIAARHELAHAFGDFGEEYDLGEDYSGPNFAGSARLCTPGEAPRAVGGRRVYDCVSWGRWLDTPRGEGAGTAAEAEGGAAAAATAAEGGAAATAAEGGAAAAEAEGGAAAAAWVRRTATSSALVLAAYPWRRLARGEAWNASFEVGAGAWRQLRLQFSVSGAPRAADLAAHLDGAPLAWTARPHRDRQFHAIGVPGAAAGRVAPGTHTLVLTGGEGAPTLCHLFVHVLRAPAEGGAARGAPARTDAPRAAVEPVGAFPVYGERGALLGYRPTQDGCLMRDMRRGALCAVCREALWENLLLSPAAAAAGVSLLRGATLALPPARAAAAAAGRAALWVRTAPLGPLRRVPPGAGAGAGVAREALVLRLSPLLPPSAAASPHDAFELRVQAAPQAGAGLWREEVPVARLLLLRRWRLRAELLTPQVRRFQVASSLCFGVAASAGRLSVECMACDAAAAPVRPACPALHGAAAGAPGGGVQVGPSCPEWFRVVQEGGGGVRW